MKTAQESNAALVKDRKERIENLIKVLTPCIKRNTGMYVTEWGRKSKEGLRATIYTIIFED